MEKNEWVPTPIYVPDLPTEPPPEKEKGQRSPLDPEIGEKQNTTPSINGNGSTVINGEDDRAWYPDSDMMKEDDEM